jgi:hypothetical protein
VCEIGPGLGCMSPLRSICVCRSLMYVIVLCMDGCL